MNKLCQRMKDTLHAITACELEKKYELSLALYAADAAETDAQPECSHAFRGQSRHKLWKLAGLYAALVLSVALIGSVCAMLRCKK